jgi:hypothetical protein
LDTEASFNRLIYFFFLFSTCIASPDYCHDENWFRTSINGILEEKFHIGKNLTFAFIDSYAKKPSSLDDIFQQAAFERESTILWNAATSSEKFLFKSIEDILEENKDLKVEVDYYKGVLDDNITDIFESLEVHDEDITDLRIQQGHTSGK